MWKKAAKTVGLSALRGAGLFQMAGRSDRRRNRLLILCYHGLSLRDEHEWLGGLFIPPALFRERMALLRRASANVLPLGEALQRLRDGSLPERSVAITFDDGFYDFHVHAVPVLREFGFPATLYLTTHYCQYRLPIVNLAIEYVLWKSGRETVGPLPELGIESEVAVTTYDGRQVVKQAMLRFSEQHGIDTVGRNDLVAKLAGTVGVEYQPIVDSRILQIMNPEEVAATAATAGIDIELHTHRHRTPRNHELFLREIRDNAAAITEMTGRKPTHFCYPSGDYAAEFLPWLRECGVESATTCELALARPGSDPLLLPRLLDDCNVTGLDFESYLYGVR